MSMNDNHVGVTTLTLTSPSTEIATPRYLELVQRYRTFAKACAENIVKLAETLVIAQRRLAPDTFGEFCKEVGLDPEGSTFRKLVVIGKAASRFEPFVERMPNSWTTVYKLAKIDSNAFDRVTQSEQFSPFMTANDVALILDGPPSVKKARRTDLSIDLGGLDEQTKIEVYNQLQSLKDKFHFELTVGVEFAKIANNAPTFAGSEHNFSKAA